MTLGSFADLFASEYPSNVEMIEIAPKDNRDFWEIARERQGEQNHWGNSKTEACDTAPMLLRRHPTVKVRAQFPSGNRKLYNKINMKWRKRWDSNPRYGFPHAGFQDRFLKPLGHSSI